MAKRGSVSDSEGLRRAVSWLAEQPRRDGRTIEEACRRFDLSPLDAQFLLERFRSDGPPDGGDPAA